VVPEDATPATTTTLAVCIDAQLCLVLYRFNILKDEVRTVGGQNNMFKTLEMGNKESLEEFELKSKLTIYLQWQRIDSNR
jgi:hypothetical protein